MIRRNALLFSVILFIAGLLLTNNDVRLGIISCISNLFHLHLDVVFRSFGLCYCGYLFIALSISEFLFFLSGKKIISRQQFYFFSSPPLVIFYFFFLWKDSVNIPITDDYRILIFLNQYANSHSFSEKWQLIMQPPLQCRIMEVPKLYVTGIWEIFGSINFRWLIMVNGCVLLAISFLLFRSFHHPQKPLFQLAFLFLLLQFQSFDSAFWTIGGISFYWTFLFVILAIQSALSNSHSRFFLSLLFSTLASFTLGNGLIAFPVCCLLFYYQSRNKQAIAFILPTLIIYIIYFYWWPYPQEVSEWQFNPLRIFIYACGFLGSSMQFMYSLYIPVLTGLLCIVVFIYATVKKYYRDNPVTWAVLLFIILTAFITAPLRLDMGPLQSRYGLYSMASIILSITIVAEMSSKKKTSKRFPIFILTCAIGYNFLSGMMFYPEAPVRKIKLQNFVNDWKSGKPLTYNPPVIADDAEKYMLEAEKSGIWNAPDDTPHH